MANLNKPQMIGGLDTGGNLIPVKVASDGTIAVSGVSGGGGSSDSTAANQVIANDKLTSIDNKTTTNPATGAKQDTGNNTLNTLLKEGSDITGATMPTGGANARGWLSAIWKAFTDRVPILTLVSDRLKVDVSGSTLPTDASTATLQSSGNTSLSSINNKLPSALVGDRLKVDLPSGLSTETTLATLLKEGTDITGAAMPTGGASSRGWLSAIWKLLSDRISPFTMIGDRLKVDVTRPVLAGNIASIIITNANTEYSFNVALQIRRYSFQILSGGDCRYSFISGFVASSTLPYYLLKIGAEESEDFQTSHFFGTLYFASSTPNTIVLIKYWN